MNEIVKTISKTASHSLAKVGEIGAKQIKEFHIDCGSLDDYNNIDIRESKSYREFFIELQSLTGPCVYFFTITSEHGAAQIVEKIRNYSSTVDAKAIPAIKKQIPDSRILYVGKVKRLMWGRVIQHLGYYKVKRTQGLQLFYWAKELGFSVKITIMEFEPEMINLMEVIECELARQLKPILGKHKS